MISSVISDLINEDGDLEVNHRKSLNIPTVSLLVRALRDLRLQVTLPKPQIKEKRSVNSKPAFG